LIKYIGKRLIIAIPVFIGITILVYVMSSMAPGDPVRQALSSPDATLEDIARLRAQWGLDKPVIVQYLNWLGRFITGNMGTSYRTGRPVGGMILERIGPTLLITGTSIILSLVIAIPFGIMAAYKPYSAWDYAASGFAFFGAATPAFFAALVFLYFFSVTLKVLPTGGMYGNDGVKSLGILLVHMILPTVTLMLGQVGSYIRQVRSSVLEVLGEDYVRTARSKGLVERKVVLRHALRNALMPIVTLLGMSVPFLVGGAVVTEQIFGWPGIGSLMVYSITTRDYPTIMGISTVIAIAVLLINIILDIVYAVLDPRIRME
jgi:peptide/nickel transport system permease protein